MSEQVTAYIGLGGNLNDRKACIDKALKMLAELPDTELIRTSDFIETKPLAQMNQPNYLNAVAEIKTTLTAEQLHAKTKDIEIALGRTKTEKWSPRTIDLDILLFGDEIINNPDLTIPHSQMHLRSFVLNGLCQLNPQLMHPLLQESVTTLAARLGGSDFVLNPKLPQLISIAGLIGVGKTTLAKKISQVFDSRLLLEPYDTNPFMPDVYAGKKELALDSQLYFLTHRVEQLGHNTLAPGRIAVSDYIFDKELIYARRLLDTQQLTLYEKIYPSLSSQVSPPVLVIYMTDLPQTCLERIQKRNRLYEQKIQLKFLQALNSDYQKLFSDWRTCPVIRVSTSELDYTKDADVNHLTNQIRNYVAVCQK
jgi:2-amino-4-hydroxy-6-hydroxymethyldihydropteridine diphosphokinase